MGTGRPADLTNLQDPELRPRAGATRQRAPLTVVLAAIVLLALALLQVAVASLFVTTYDEIVGVLTSGMPGASPEQVSDRIVATIGEGIAAHAFLALVYTAAAIVLRHPGRSIRIFVTALAIVATISEGLILGQLPTILPAEGNMVLGALVIGTALRVLLITLLWVPTPSRRWFGGNAAPI